MKRPIEARYTLTLEDFNVLTRAYRGLTVGRRAARFVYFAMLALLGAEFLISLWIMDWQLAAFCLAGLVGLLAIEYVIAPWQVRRQFAHQRLGDFEIAFSASDEGFDTRSALAHGQHRWEAVRQVDDLPGHVLLWPNNRLGWVVPKRAFATVDEAEAFIRLAKERTAGQKL